MARRLKPMTGRRRAALLVLMAAVVAMHLGVTSELAEGLIDLNTAKAMPPRMAVAYVRELELAAPPVVAPRMAAPPPLAVPVAAVPASGPASAPKRPKRPKKRREPIEEPIPEPIAEPAMAAAEPASAASEPEPVIAAASAAASEPIAEPAVEPTSVADAVASPAPAASGAAAFEWPASTRLSYVLTGNYRGEVHGDAQVEWVRNGDRYQVNLDLLVGPSFAPLVTRRMSSDGELGATGLVPRRYDQDTKVVFRDRRRVTMLFQPGEAGAPGSVVLANGDRRESVAGLQDSASQFVQLTYLFTTQPERLKVGAAFEIPLALPNRLDRWTYDVLGEEVLYTPFGELPTFHLKPRRESAKPGDLSAEIWFAPQLRYLPVRIRIAQDEANFVDMMITRLPQLAAPP